ncbi:MAG: SxtJ family membrane protein [Gammaproteobacteria bacterium]|jgi:hypothetical protein|nr:SxtJ family membrane protein [Gammaproteobacteria bacterium]
MNALKPTADKIRLRQFGLIMGAMLVLFFGLLIPWIWDLGLPVWPWIAAAVFVGLGLAAPGALGPIYWVWMKIGDVVGWINQRLILGVLFFGIFLPMGLVMRSLRKDPMSRRFDRNAQSYRVRSRQPKMENLERPF